ncbi:aldo/keto reductase [Paraburkholderia jirisanensis]
MSYLCLCNRHINVASVPHREPARERAGAWNCPSERASIAAPWRIADRWVVSGAQIALAWLRRNPVVAAPLGDATKRSHIDDAIASLVLQLTADELAVLETPYTPRQDVQGVSDDAVLACLSAEFGIKPAKS